MEEYAKGAEYDALYDVMAEIVDRTETPAENIDRIIIQRSTDREWPCRIYPAGGADWEGILVVRGD